MLKIIVCFFLMTALQISTCFCAGLVDRRPTSVQAKESLKNDNIAYIDLMVGTTKGINDAKGTDQQLIQMVDGCITAGITDRLFGLGDQSSKIIQQIKTLTTHRKLHAQLTLAFYVLGYLNPPNDAGLQQILVGLPEGPSGDFGAEFSALCQLVFSHGTIFEYRNNLEDVVKRASQPLKFSDFGEVAAVVAPPIAAPAALPIAVPAPAEVVGPVERYYTDAELANQPAETIAQYKQARDVAKRTAKAARMGSGLPAKFEGAAAPIVAQVEAVVPQAQGEERYYTDDELANQPAETIAQYKQARDVAKRTAKAARMGSGLPAKYAPAGAPPSVPVVAQASAGGLFASIAAGKALKATTEEHPDQKPKEPVAAAAPVEPKQANPMMDEMAKRIAAIKAAKEAEEARKIAAGENPDGDDSGSDSDWD
ncbi:MAG: hypothetical protein WCJ92_02625 [Alphaproteobacteria bacterium]